MNIIKYSLITILIAFSSITSAHSALNSSNPANGTELDKAPKVLQLVFNKAVRLMKIELMDMNNNKIELDYKMSGKPALEFEMPISTIQPGVYRVKWMSMGADAHKMTGEFNFSFKVPRHQDSDMKKHDN